MHFFPVGKELFVMISFGGKAYRLKKKKKFVMICLLPSGERRIDSKKKFRYDDKMAAKYL